MALVTFDTGTAIINVIKSINSEHDNSELLLIGTSVRAGFGIGGTPYHYILCVP